MVKYLHFNKSKNKKVENYFCIKSKNVLFWHLQKWENWKLIQIKYELCNIFDQTLGSF